MAAFRRQASRILISILLLSILFVLGCAPAIKYSYELNTNFSQLKTYTWVKPSGMYSNDPLLETNVQILTDQILAQKGFSRVLENPDLALSMSYEFDGVVYQDNYRLRMLSLYVYSMRSAMAAPPPTAPAPATPAPPPGASMQTRGVPQRMEVIWRGTATGTIKTDAASGNLKKVVEEILSNFPPRVR